MHQLCCLPYKQVWYNPRLSSRCLQEDCGLVVDFASFPALLLKLLNLLVEQPSTYLGLLVLRADGSAVLEFAQNLEFKAMSLLSMRVAAVPQVGDGIGREQPQCTHGRRVGLSTLLPHFCLSKHCGRLLLNAGLSKLLQGSLNCRTCATQEDGSASGCPAS
jgi:hypothetical protein